jgi:hypothetical protein
MGGHTAAHLLLGHTKNLAPLYSATPELLLYQHVYPPSMTRLLPVK